MDENKFWLYLCMGCLATIALLMVCITIYNVNMANIQEGMVRAGNEPIAVRCMTASSGDAICVAYAAGRP